MEPPSVHYKHEADALFEIARRRHLIEAAHGGINDFVDYADHRCVCAKCTMIGTPHNETYYVCPTPIEHPPHLRNSDGSVTHRWSKELFVCYNFGALHVCNQRWCDHQHSIDGELVCRLTGRVHGVEIHMMQDLSFAFDSGKVMTTSNAPNIDLDSMRMGIDSYMNARPENRDRHTQAERALMDAQRNVSSVDLRTFTKRRIDAASSAISIEQAPKRTITDKSESSGPLARLPPPLTIPSDPSEPPRPVAESGRPISAVGDGPTESDIRHFFVQWVTRLWDSCEKAYSIRARRRELHDAERRAVPQLIDKRSFGSGGPKQPKQITFDAVATIHARETRATFEGLEYVHILSAWPDWTSGEIRRVHSAVMAERMWKLWELITRSPHYQTNPEPHLYLRIAGAMIDMLIEGYSIGVCEQRTPKNKRFWATRCQHRKNAVSQDDCGHQQSFVTMIAPTPVMQQLLAPPGMVTRILQPVVGHTLRHRNAIVLRLSTLFEGGLTAAQVRQSHISLDV